MGKYEACRNHTWTKPTSSFFTSLLLMLSFSYFLPSFSIFTHSLTILSSLSLFPPEYVCSLSNGFLLVSYTGFPPEYSSALYSLIPLSKRALPKISFFLFSQEFTHLQRIFVALNKPPEYPLLPRVLSSCLQKHLEGHKKCQKKIVFPKIQNQGSTRVHTTILDFSISKVVETYEWILIFHVHPHTIARLAFYCEKLVFEKVGVVIIFFFEKEKK